MIRISVASRKSLSLQYFGSDAIVGEGNAFTFRTNCSTYMLSDMAGRCGCETPGETMATIAPNYEFGISCGPR